MKTVFRLLIGFALAYYPAATLALAGSTSARQADLSPTYGDALNWSVSLLLVLAIFMLCVWLVRKTGQFSLPGKNQLGIVTALSLGMREKVVLLRVGDKQLLLGVTPNRIDKLMELEGDERLFQSSEHRQGEFSGKLMQAIKGRPDG